MDNDVIVVHPFGGVHVFRQSILDIRATRISAQEADRRAAALRTKTAAIAIAVSKTFLDFASWSRFITITAWQATNPATM